MKNTLKRTLLSKNILYLESVKTGDPLDYTTVINSNCGILGAVLRSIGSLGYAFDKESLLKIAAMSRSELKNFYDETFDFLGDVTGLTYNVKTVLFPEFPNVENLSVEDMFFRTIIHYFSSAISDLTGFTVADTAAPAYAATIPFDEKTTPKVLKLKTATDQAEVDQVLTSYFKNYLSGTVAIPNTKKTVLEDIYTWFALKGRDSELIPDEIPFKENIVYLFGLLMNQYGSINNIFDKLTKHELEFNFLKTVTDYLRLYTYLSVNNYMIGSNVKYKTFSRKIRRWFLRELNGLLTSWAKCAEFASHREEWIYVFENLHPGDYATKYPRVYNAASALRDGTLRTFNSDVEQAFIDGDTNEVVRLLSQRPGLYARSLDRALRNDRIDTVKILEGFTAIADQIATPVLLQLYTYYLRRQLVLGPRVFTIKQENNTKYYGKEDDRNPLRVNDIHLILKTLKLALSARQADKENEEIDGMKVWLDESMKKYAIPANNRAASDNIQSIPSGSYIEFTPDKDVLRLFTHWKNMDNSVKDSWVYSRGRVDIDLSCMIMDAEFNKICEYSWRSYRDNGDIGLSFSGDVTNAPHGANEFIDINYKQLLAKRPEARYIVISNNVFTGQPFKDIPECFSGVMFRENLGKHGEVFEASTVATKFDLNQDGTNMNIAAVVDLVTMRLYYVDQPLQGSYRVVGTNFDTLSNVVRDAVAPRISMYDMVKIAAKSKKFTLTRKPERANFIISDDETAQLRPWDQELFAKIFM